MTRMAWAAFGCAGARRRAVRSQDARNQDVPEPDAESKKGSTGTYGMAGDRDGNGWLSVFGIDVMTKHEYATGKSYDVHLPHHRTRRPRTSSSETIVGSST